MNRASWILLAVLILAVGSFLTWRAMRPGAPPPVIPASIEPSQPAAGEPAPPPVPTPQAASPPMMPAEPSEPLPALDESDPEVRTAAVELLGADYVDQLLVPADIIRKSVVTVDNLPRDKIALRLRAVPPLPGRFIASEGGDEWTVISAENFARYTPWVNVFVAADSGRIADLYLRFYPLLQQAYQDLGYPDQQFHGRVIAMIDDLLAAPEIDAPIRLVRPHVLYQYADPGLEERSAGQKTLIRMGQQNAAAVKQKLREIKTLIGAANSA